MPIISSDILFRLSVPSASAGNANAQSNVSNSLGGFVSTTNIVDNTLNNLFDDVSGQENADEDVEYRCIFVLNNHATLTLRNTVVWISSEVADGANISIGLDPAGATTKTSGTAQAAIIAAEGNAPAGVTFSAPTSKATGLSIGSLAAGYCYAIWLRRTATNSAAKSNDGVTIKIEGDTEA